MLHTISMGRSEMPGVYRMEIQAMAGGGKVGVSGSLPREPVRVAFDYFKANCAARQRIDQPERARLPPAPGRTAEQRRPQALTLASFIALCSAALGQACAVANGRDGRHEPGRHASRRRATWPRACRSRLMPVPSGSCCRCPA